MIFELCIVAASILQANQQNTKPDFIERPTRRDPVFELRMKKSNAARSVIGRMHNERRHELADSYLKTFKQDNPDMAEWLVEESIESDIFLGRYEEARPRILKMIEERKAGRNETHRQWLALALVDALTEKPDSAQHAYLRAFVQIRPETWGVHELEPFWMTYSDSKSVAVLSCFALSKGSGLGLAYLELALKLDPGNIQVGRDLVLRYRLYKRQQDRRRVAAILIKNIPDGLDRQWFQHWIKDDR